MYFKPYLVLSKLLFLSVSFITTDSFDPFSLDSYTGAGVAVGKFIQHSTYCSFTECCNEKHIIDDFSKLKRLLNTKVYGQHLAVNIVYDAIKSHWKNDNAPKALTISMHGSTGIGKNYITNIVKESLFEKGSDSKFVHHFTAGIHFPIESKLDEYKQNVYNWVKGNVSSCPYQLFIFDEVDKTPVGLFDILKPVIDYNDKVDRVDYRKCIFIFISNTGGTTIIKELLKYWDQGKLRDELSLHDFERVISQGAFNEKGGFQFSSTIKSNLIDHYVPFLPLELPHVKLCIKEEFSKRGFVASEEDIDEVLKTVDWGPSPNNIFAKTGCKRLSQKAAVVAQRKFRREIL